MSVSTISNSYATGAVSGRANAYIGGLVGYSEGSITGSFASGPVTDGGKSVVIGGLVGRNDGTIDNSYSIGGVSGGVDAEVGGIAGYSDWAISDSYAIGAVSGRSGSILGGLVGYGDGEASYTDDFWDTTSSGITNLGQGVGNTANASGVTGLTTAQFQSGLPTGFNPTIWGEDPSINGGLPYLLALPPS